VIDTKIHGWQVSAMSSLAIIA